MNSIRNSGQKTLGDHPACEFEVELNSLPSEAIFVTTNKASKFVKVKCLVSMATVRNRPVPQ